MDKFNILNILAAILAGCAIRVAMRLEAGLGIPPWGDGGGTDVTMNYPLNPETYQSHPPNPPNSPEKYTRGQRGKVFLGRV